MLARTRRCPECDYTWSRYLDFPTCPQCGSDVADAKVGIELTRTKRIVLVSIILGTIISVLANLIMLLLD